MASERGGGITVPFIACEQTAEKMKRPYRKKVKEEGRALKQLFDPKDVGAKGAEEHRRLVGELNKHLLNTSAEHAFMAYAITFVGDSWKQLDKRGFGDSQPALIELAAFHLFPHFGNREEIDPGSVQAIIDLIEPLQLNRTWEIMFLRERAADPQLEEISTHLRLYRESVRGAAYADQTREYISKIQGAFEKWFQQMGGIGPNRALELLDGIQQQLKRNHELTRTAAIQAFPEAQMDQRREGKDYAALAEFVSIALPTLLPVGRDQLDWMNPPPTGDEWAGLIKLVGCTRERCIAAKQPSDLKSFPLFVLPGERVILFDLACFSDELFAGFDRMARTDRPFYDRKYLKQQTRWTEERIAELLRRVFPRDSVYSGLTYPDPDRAGGEAELDAAVELGPFLILLEAKGCQFRLDVAHEDFGRLRTDLKKNVEEAFDQAQRASRYLDSNPIAVFGERKTGREMRVTKSKVHRVFKLSVTLHHLADLTTQLANLRPLNLFAAGDYPFSVSLADFDIITRFCEGPDVLLHYVQRRLELQRSGKNIHGDELDIFGMYLDCRLHPSQVWERKEKGKGFTMMILTGGSEQFDQWKNAELGIGKVPEINLKLPSAVKNLLQALRDRNDDAGRWIAFSVLNLSTPGIERLQRVLNDMRAQRPKLRRMRSTVFVDGDMVAVFAVGYGADVETLRKTVFTRTALEKYRRKAPTALGFSIDLINANEQFDSALWLESKWTYSADMEKALQQVAPLVLQPGGKLPGRNEPCICGSNRRFKKCCLPLLRRAPETGQYSIGT
jgi:hypothetical protein